MLSVCTYQWVVTTSFSLSFQMGLGSRFELENSSYETSTTRPCGLFYTPDHRDHNTHLITAHHFHNLNREAPLQRSHETWAC